MKNIAQLLEKYKSFGLKEKKTKEAVIGVVKEVIGVEISTKQIDLHENQIRIQVSGPVRSKLLLKKDQIQKNINQKTSEKFVLK